MIIAGGRGTRLGGSELGDKADVVFDGQPLLEHALAVVDGFAPIVVVGPRRATSRPVRWCQEDPPGGGPPAALRAGLECIDLDVDADLVAVTGVDMPWLRPGLEALAGGLLASPDLPAAALVSDDGGPQPLAALWRIEPLRRIVAHGLPSLRAAFAEIDWLRVPDVGRWATDIDTPGDLATPSRADPDGLSVREGGGFGQVC